MREMLHWKYRLFGPVYRKGGGQSTTSTTTQQYSPEEAARRTQVQDEAARIYGATKDQFASAGYPGPAVVPFSPETQQSQQMLASYAVNGAQPLVNTGQSAANFGLSGVLDVNNNPSLQGYAQSLGSTLLGQNQMENLLAQQNLANNAYQLATQGQQVGNMIGTGLGNIGAGQNQLFGNLGAQLATGAQGLGSSMQRQFGDLNLNVEEAARLAGRNFSDVIMPQIRSGFINSGQLGSTRQGIAEGVAAGRVGQDLASAVRQAGMSGANNLGIGNQTLAQQLGLAGGQAANNLGDATRSLGQQAGQAYTGLGMGLGQTANSVAQQFGSMQQGQALRNLGTQAQMAGLYNNAYNQGLNTMSSTLGQLPNVLAAGTYPSAMLGAIGSQNEQLAQSQENAAAQQRVWDLNKEWTPLQNYANIVYGGSNPMTVSTNQYPGPSSGQTAMQGIGLLASIAGMFMSDVRLKSDIKRLGQLPSGIGIYSYRLLGRPEVGVLAQEVETVLPEAVVEINGIKHVNYGVLQ
jgi:hypothetical protein